MPDPAVDADLICVALDDALRPDERVGVELRLVVGPEFRQRLADQRLAVHLAAAGMRQTEASGTARRVGWLILNAAEASALYMTRGPWNG